MNDSLGKRDKLVRDIAQEGLRLAIASRGVDENPDAEDSTANQSAELDKEVIERTEEVVSKINNQLGNLAPELQEKALENLKYQLDVGDHPVDNVQTFVHDIGQRVQRLRELSMFETDEKALDAVLLAHIIEVEFDEDDEYELDFWMREFTKPGLNFEQMTPTILRISCDDKLENYVDRDDFHFVDPGDPEDEMPLIVKLMNKIKYGRVRIVE